MSGTIHIQSNDVNRDLKWYAETLLFDKMTETSLRKEETILSFEANASPEKQEIRIQVQNLDEVFESYVVTGIATIERPPAMTFFGTKELNLTDLNGHKLVFFEEI